MLLKKLFISEWIPKLAYGIMHYYNIYRQYQNVSKPLSA